MIISVGFLGVNMAARKKPRNTIWRKLGSGESLKRFTGKNSANTSKKEVARYQKMGLKAYRERRKIYNPKTKKFDRVAYDVYPAASAKEFSKWEKKYRPKR